MNYQDALIYFRDRSDYDRGFISNPFAGDDAAANGLQRTRLLLDQLGGPDRAYPIIHVAGTKGKGSTCAFIDSIARALGFTTGMFVTPHLHSVRERIHLDGNPISELTFARTMEIVAAATSEIEQARPELGRLTAFEISTAQSLLAFSENGIEMAIVEVGLGGRLDATNIVTPTVSVITPISFDHEAILGRTIAAIASEKAGIIKHMIPVVSGVQEPDALSVIVGAAEAQEAPLAAEGRNWNAVWSNGRSTITGPWGEFGNVRLGLRGPHQAQNAGLAMAALWTFDSDLFVRSAAIRRGLEAATWPGRFEQLNARPIVIADGAHNVAAINVLVAALDAEFEPLNISIVFGSYKDKDLGGMLCELAPLSPEIVATRSNSPRARQPEDIALAAREAGLVADSHQTVSAALDAAIGAAKSGDIIVVTGSLSVVAEAREYFGLGHVTDLERHILAG